MKILLVLLLLPFNLEAKVISSGQNGFHIQIERTVKASQKVAYQQFLKIAEWWDADHTYFGKASNLSLQTRAGGCFCEINGDNQVLHMLVTYVEPNREVRMVGGLGPLQMMGIHGGMSWKFEAIDNNQTKIIHSYQVTGYSKDGLDKLAAIVDQVQQVQVDSLISKFSVTNDL